MKKYKHLTGLLLILLCVATLIEGCKKDPEPPIPKPVVSIASIDSGYCPCR